MRRIIVAALITLSLSTLAACSPYDTPAAAQAATPASAPCDRACWAAIVARQRAERAWWAEVVAAQRRARDWNRLLAHLAATRRPTGRLVAGIEVCNGSDLPTCAIVWRESRFDPHAENPTSTASGLYQFIDSTWRTCRTGHPHAAWAPVSVQVACARRIWAGGRGARHWRL